jgi:hypothetical protein
MRSLAELLAALALRLEPSTRELSEVGRQWGNYLAGRPGEKDIDSLPLELERLGFDARLQGMKLEMSGCPCPLVAPQNPELVCALMKAVVDGIAEATTERLRVASSVHDPARRHCAIALYEQHPRGSRRRSHGGDRSKAMKGEPSP